MTCQWFSVLELWIINANAWPKYDRCIAPPSIVAIGPRLRHRGEEDGSYPGDMSHLFHSISRCIHEHSYSFIHVTLYICQCMYVYYILILIYALNIMYVYGCET